MHSNGMLQQQITAISNRLCSGMVMVNIIIIEDYEFGNEATTAFRWRCLVYLKSGEQGLYVPSTALVVMAWLERRGQVAMAVFR